MSVTGLALVLFLTFHACMNVVALFSAEAYNQICELLGSNWYALAATAGLGALVVIHIIYAFILTIQNRKARGNNRYDKTDTPEKVEWASQNMFALGVIIVLGLALHLFNFWYNMMFAELMGFEEMLYKPSDGSAWITHTFSNPVFVIIYVIWICALWLHLNHGIWSAMQTIGWNGNKWLNRWILIGKIWSTVVCAGFLCVVLAAILRANGVY